MGEYALSNLYQYHEMPQKRREYLALIGEIMDVRKRSHTPMAYVHTYGCQQNVADSTEIGNASFGCSATKQSNSVAYSHV